MRVRTFTWGEFSAWLGVTDRAARAARADAVLDAAIARVGGDDLKSHLETLRRGE